MSDPEVGTEAVKFDPFAEDDISALMDDLQAMQAQTGAVAYDPFADDDELPEIEIPSRVDAPHAKALDTFRSRRATVRGERRVANGMVSLPFIPLVPEDEALLDASPPLQRGEVLAGQYEIRGVIGHGGMGWIYLANDKNVSGRQVVLKGLMAKHSHDYAAAIAEREFLADITHPGVVKAYNFIDDPRIEGGLIVMEYVPGPSLRALKPFPIDIAIGYILEILPALEYLHNRGVVYNDLKPDNIIATEDQVKLIDLGAVSGIGAYGFIYGTKGFQAPEVATEGPSIASDIYTIGRTLAALTVQLPVEDGAYAHGLPVPEDEPVFAHNMSFYRLLRRATADDPKKRFGSIRELETQLYGVLREYVAITHKRQFPAQHSLYSPQRNTFGTKHLVFRTDQLLDGIARNVRITPEEINAALPVPLLDRDDPGAVLISGFSYTSASETLETMRQAMAQEEFADSKEIPLGVVRALLDLGFTKEAKSWLHTLQPRLGSDWRHQWYSGVTALLLEDFDSAQSSFNEVYNILPGEAAPKLARAALAELILQQRGFEDVALLDSDIAMDAASLRGDALEQTGGNWSVLTSDSKVLRFKCIYMYALVWTTNPSTVSSAFGLARQLIAEKQIEAAVNVLDQVPQQSRHHRMAQLTAILHLISGDLSEARIRRAARRLEEIPTNEPRFLQITIAILNAALRWLRENNLDSAASTLGLLEYEFTQHGLREGLSECLRLIARNAPSAKHRYSLVDMANQVRPTTWF